MINMFSHLPRSLIFEDQFLCEAYVLIYTVYTSMLSTVLRWLIGSMFSWQTHRNLKQ
jgi:hypothetical protein